MAVKKQNHKKRKRETGKTIEKQIGEERESLFYEYRNEIGFVLMTTFSILLFLSNLGLIGPIGRGIKSLGFGLFGFLSWLFPIFLFFAVTIWMANKENRRVKLKIWLSFGIFWVLTAISELIRYPKVAEMGFNDLYLSSAAKSDGGGFFGGIFAKALASGLALVGAYLVLTALLIIFVIFLTGNFFVNPIKKRAEKTKNHLLELRKEQMEEARRRAEIKSEIRKENRDLKRAERERAREERIQKLRDFHLLDGLEGSGLSKASEKEAAGSKIDSFEPVLGLKEIGTPEKSDLSAVLHVNEGESQEKKSEGLYQTILENKFGKEDEAILPTEFERRPPAWRILEDENEVLQAMKMEDDDKDEIEETKEEKKDFEEDIKRAEEAKKIEEAEEIKEETLKETEEESRIEIEDEVIKEPDEVKEEAEKEAEKEVDEVMEDTEEKLPKAYHYPPSELLTKPENEGEGVSEEDLYETAVKLQNTLEAFGVKAKVTDVSCGPSVTRYELQPEIGVKVSKITSLSDDIKLNLAAADIRIEAPIPGKAAVGIEVPNKTNTIVYFRELIESKEFRENSSKLTFAVGKDIGGKTMVTDIAKMPHLLIAGATGSGKSVCINTLIMSMLYKAKPDEVKFIMIDPKVVELSCYNGIPHLLLPVVTDPKKAAAALNWAVAEMNRRYTLFAEEGARNIKGFNKSIGKDSPNWLPQIVIIVDELADLMMVASKDVEEAICRLAQLARAAGIHLVIATQRPSVNVITGLIKANIPSRIAFAVSSQVDSRTILDGAGAEKLLGKGDMLFFPYGYSKPVRVQGAFVSDNEVADLVKFLRENNEEAHSGEDISKAVNEVAATEGLKEIVEKNSLEDNLDDYDEYFDEAGKFIIEKQKASIGMLQRIYRIGFNRAARIMDQLAEAGVVSEEDGTRARKILMSKEEFLHFLSIRHGEENGEDEEL